MSKIKVQSPAKLSQMSKAKRVINQTTQWLKDGKEVVFIGTEFLTSPSGRIVRHQDSYGRYRNATYNLFLVDGKQEKIGTW